jgi:predicted enzyme related to lactoylglutathione lyase
MQLSNKNLCVIIWSGNYEQLAIWYEKVLGFKVRDKVNLPNDTYIDFDFGNNYFSIGKHNKVKGYAKDPYRIMIGFNVESVTALYDDLKQKDVEFVAPPFEAPPGGFWCMTIKDPDGNIIQFFSDKK